MSNRDKNFYFGCLIAFLIAVIILMLTEYTAFPFINGLVYLSWGTIIVTIVAVIESTIRIWINSRNNKNKK